MEKTNILITSAGRRVSLVKAFKNEITTLGRDIKVFTTDAAPSFASACHVSDGYFEVGRVTEPTYMQDLFALCKKEHITVVIPTIDTELAFLATHRESFLEEGIHLVISDLNIIESCRDKRKIHSFFDQYGLERAQDIEMPTDIFPIFIKPYDGSRSQGIHLIENKEMLTAEIVNNPKNLFLEFIDPLENREFTVDIYFNRNSEIITVIPRERIFVRDGEVNKACTRKNSIVNYVKDKLGSVKGFRGCITLQVFLNNVTNKIIGIEINPRFGGGYPLSYEAGGNFPLWIISEYIDNKDIFEYTEAWEDNLLMLRYDAEVLVKNHTK